MRIPDILVVAAVAVFALVPVRSQIDDLGYAYLGGEQLLRHESVIAGKAGNPWQYRVFAEFLIHPAVVVARRISPSGGAAAVFIAFRAFLSVALFIAAYVYYRNLGCSAYASLIGLSLISRGMCFAHYNSDLSFNTSVDILIYLCALIMITGRFSPSLFVLLCAIGALNRETSAFLPLILACAVLWGCPEGRGGARSHGRLTAAVAGAMVWIGIFVALRLLYGPRPLAVVSGRRVFTWAMVNYNVGRMMTWRVLLRTFGITPLLAVAMYRYWPPLVGPLFFLLVPAWLLIQTGGAVLAESRVLLVPYILVVVPAATAGLENWLTGSPPERGAEAAKESPRREEGIRGKPGVPSCGARAARGPGPRGIGAALLAAGLLGWHQLFAVYSHHGRFDPAQLIAVLFCLAWGVVFIKR